jgi:hypothetical protein
VARDLGVPEHYLRLAVGRRRQAAHVRRAGRLGSHLAIDECSVRKNFVYATVFSDPERGVVIDLAPGRDAAAVLLPGEARAPVSYGPRARATVAYLLGRQHVPNRRVVAAMRDLFGLEISAGSLDSVYAEAGRRLKGFVLALVAVGGALKESSSPPPRSIPGGREGFTIVRTRAPLA